MKIMRAPRAERSRSASSAGSRGTASSAAARAASAETAYYTVNRYVTLYGELAESTFSNNPVFKRPTATRYATVGGRFMW